MLTPDEQMEAYKKRLTEHPASLVFLPLTELYVQRGDYQAAEEVCRHGLKYHASLTKAKYVLGEILFYQNRLVEAAEWFRAVLQDDPTHAQAKEYLARITQQGQLSTPEASSQPSPTPALKGEGEEAEFLTPTMAELYVKQGLTEDAIRIYRQILQTQPNHPQAKKRLAELAGGEQTSPEEALLQRLENVRLAIRQLSEEVQRIEQSLNKR